MDREEAMKRVRELEGEVDRLQIGRLSDADKTYVERLKTDMRKAAAKREQTEKLLKDAHEKLKTTTAFNRIERLADKAGCRDSKALRLLLVSENVLNPDGSQDFEDVIQQAKEQRPYLFRSKKENVKTDMPRPIKPVAFRYVHKETTQNKAARAYKTD